MRRPNRTMHRKDLLILDLTSVRLDERKRGFVFVNSAAIARRRLQLQSRWLNFKRQQWLALHAQNGRASSGGLALGGFRLAFLGLRVGDGQMKLGGARHVVKEAVEVTRR